MVGAEEGNSLADFGESDGAVEGNSGADLGESDGAEEGNSGTDLGESDGAEEGNSGTDLGESDGAEEGNSSSNVCSLKLTTMLSWSIILTNCSRVGFCPLDPPPVVQKHSSIKSIST